MWWSCIEKGVRLQPVVSETMFRLIFGRFLYSFIWQEARLPVDLLEKEYIQQFPLLKLYGAEALTKQGKQTPAVYNYSGLVVMTRPFWNQKSKHQSLPAS